MKITQHDITRAPYYDSVFEIERQEQEKKWIDAYQEDGKAFTSLVEMFEHEVGHPKYETARWKFVKTEFHELELFVVATVEGRIDLHVVLEPGEKAVLYGIKNVESPFSNEVMLLLLLDVNGRVQKTYFFNDEYSDLYKSLEMIREMNDANKAYLLNEEGLSEEEATERLKEDSFYQAIEFAKKINDMTDVTKPHVHVIIQHNH